MTRKSRNPDLCSVTTVLEEGHIDNTEFVVLEKTEINAPHTDKGQYCIRRHGDQSVVLRKIYFKLHPETWAGNTTENHLTLGYNLPNKYLD